MNKHEYVSSKRYKAVVAELEEAHNEIEQLKAKVSELENYSEGLSNRIRNDNSYFDDRLKDQSIMHSEIRGGLEATINELRKPLLDKLSLQVPPIIVKLDESPAMLAMVKADAIREAVRGNSYIEFEYPYDEGVELCISNSLLEYADKLEAGTL